MNDILRENVLDAYLKAALREHMLKTLAEAPSDEELKKMFPRTKKDGKLLKKYVRLEKKQEASLTEQPAVLTVLKRAAVIVMAVVSLSTAVMLTDTDIRAAVEHAVVEFFDKFAKVNLAYSDDAGGEVTDIYDLTIGYIPDGFEVTETDEEQEYRFYSYYNSSKDSFIFINIAYSDSTEADVDIENTEISEITINGYNGIMFYSEANKTGGLLYGNRKITFSINGDLSKDELIKLAENLK